MGLLRVLLKLAILAAAFLCLDLWVLLSRSVPMFRNVPSLLIGLYAVIPALAWLGWRLVDNYVRTTEDRLERTRDKLQKSHGRSREKLEQAQQKIENRVEAMFPLLNAIVSSSLGTDGRVERERLTICRIDGGFEVSSGSVILLRATRTVRSIAGGKRMRTFEPDGRGGYREHISYTPTDTSYKTHVEHYIPGDWEQEIKALKLAALEHDINVLRERSSK
jgi:hypothetical protein